MFGAEEEGAASTRMTSDSDRSGARTTESMEDLHRVEATRIVLFTWKELMKKKSEVGSRIYEEVLLKEVGMSRLFMTTKIVTQADSFMHMLDAVIGYLDDPPTFDTKLQELGKMHVTKLGVKKRHFKHFRQGFMKAIKEYIPWSERREAAWLWLWTRIISGMTAAKTVVPYARDLTRDEYLLRAEKIHTTFDVMMDSDPIGFGKRFYTNLLREEPEIAKLFDEDKIENQAAKFIAMVRHTVSLLDDDRTFQFKMIELGRTHDTYGVELSMLENFGAVLTNTLKNEDAVKPLWNDEIESHWGWFWKVVTQLFTEGILERRKEIDERKEYKPRSELPVIDPSDGDASDGSALESAVKE